jgi:hypothetical protein
MNLMHHESNYDLRGQILRHLNNANLSQIVNQYFTSKPIENDKFYTAEDSEKNGKSEVSLRALSEVSKLNMRENYSIDDAKCIYPKLQYPSNK